MIEDILEYVKAKRKRAERMAEMNKGNILEDVNERLVREYIDLEEYISKKQLENKQRAEGEESAL